MIGQNVSPDVGKATQFQPGQSGNPAGKPKGSRHLRTIMQELLADPDYEQKLKNGEILKGAPMTHITKTAIALAMGKGSEAKAARDWLTKYAIGVRIDLDQKMDLRGGINITFNSNQKPE